MHNIKPMETIFAHTRTAILKRSIETPAYTIEKGTQFKYYPLDNVWTGIDTEGKERNYKNIDVDDRFFYFEQTSEATEIQLLASQMLQQRNICEEQFAKLTKRVDAVAAHLEKHFPGSPPESYLPEIEIDNNATN